MTCTCVKTIDSRDYSCLLPADHAGEHVGTQRGPFWNDLGHVRYHPGVCAVRRDGSERGCQKIHGHVNLGDTWHADAYGRTWMDGTASDAVVAAIGLLGTPEIKPRFDLLPFDALEEVARVLSFGDRKHAHVDWRDPSAVDRYLNSALAHIAAWKQGVHRDADSRLPHLAHAATKLLFLVALASEPKERGDDI